MYSLKETVFLSIIVSVIYIFARVIIILRRKTKVNFAREICLCIFTAVCAFILVSTVIPKIEINSENSVGILKPYSYSKRINIIPFSFIKDTAENLQNGFYFAVVFNIAGNIVPFACASLFAVLLWEKFGKLKTVILFGFLATLAIELLQIPLCRGCDIDDLILNMTGYILGWLVAALIKKKSPKLFYKIQK